jgi:hypothetical protein
VINARIRLAGIEQADDAGRLLQPEQARIGPTKWAIAVVNNQHKISTDKKNRA